jgi:hypothetical protein
LSVGGRGGGGTGITSPHLGWQRAQRISNGKSSIVEERLHSFFFASVQTKTKLRFFRLFSFSQSLTKTFVSLRSYKILNVLASFFFVFTNFWTTPILYTFDFESVGPLVFASLRPYITWDLIY